MASKRIIMKQTHRPKLEGGGEIVLVNRSYQLLDDDFSAALVAEGVAVFEQDVLDGKVDAETLEPIVTSPAAGDGFGKVTHAAVFDASVPVLDSEDDDTAEADEE